MASPMIESRLEPHKKAHFNLHISDRITDSESQPGSFSSVKYNHKPAQTTESRSTKLTPSSANAYNLRVEDKSSSGDKDIFTFTGNRVAPKKSYVLLFDPASQKATLEPLSDSYTFNLTTKNNKDISSQNTKIYPKKSREEHQDGDGDEDLFGEAAAEDESGDPDAANPYDFRHFLGKEKDKRGDESDFISSPDYRTGTGSAMNTPQFGARKPIEVAAPKAKAAEPASKRAKASDASMFMKKKKKPAAKPIQPPPSIHLERRASERPIPDAPKPKSKLAGPPPSKIKSTELVQSSDESDADAEGESEPVPSPPRRQRTPSPQYHAASDPSDEDADGDSDSDGILEIEIPDARPRPGTHRSLAGAANSPIRSRAPPDDGVIDFGDVGEDEEDDEEDAEGDVDVDMIDIGPPARQSTGADRKASMGGAAVEEDEDDPLYAEMMAGLAGGDSSEESEEE